MGGGVGGGWKAVQVYDGGKAQERGGGLGRGDFPDLILSTHVFPMSESHQYTCRSLSEDNAPVNHQGLPRHVIAVRPRQETHCLRHIFRYARPA